MNVSIEVRVLREYANFHTKRLINSWPDEALHDLCAVSHLVEKTSKFDPT